MKKNNILKISLSLLFFALLFGFTSCDKEEETKDYIENKRVEIIEAEVEYTEADIAEAKDKFTSTAIALAESYLDVNLNNKQKQSIESRFDTTVLPLLYDIKIYKDEFYEILTELDGYANSESTKNDATPLLLSVYEISLYVLGMDRSGKLAYNIALEILKDKIDTANERFENYGYEFYKIDSARCSLIRSDLELLGEKNFSDALSMTSIVISTLSALLRDGGENAFLLTDSELLFILNKQAESIKSHCLSNEEWQIFGGLISELIPAKSSDLNSAALYALKNYAYEIPSDAEIPNGFYKNSYFASAMQAMPKIITLFTDVSNALYSDGLFSINSTVKEKQTALSKALAKCKESIVELDLALMSFAKLGESDLKIPVSTRSDPEVLAKFMDTYSKVECADIIETVNKIEAGEDISGATLTNLLISYAFGLSPYLSFVLWSNVN